MAYVPAMKKYGDYPKELIGLYFETRGAAFKPFLERNLKKIFDENNRSRRDLHDILIEENITFRIFRDCVDSMEGISEREKGELYDDMDTHLRYYSSSSICSCWM